MKLRWGEVEETVTERRMRLKIHSTLNNTSRPPSSGPGPSSKPTETERLRPPRWRTERRRRSFLPAPIRLFSPDAQCIDLAQNRSWRTGSQAQEQNRALLSKLCDGLLTCRFLAEHRLVINGKRSSRFFFLFSWKPEASSRQVSFERCKTSLLTRGETVAAY